MVRRACEGGVRTVSSLTGGLLFLGLLLAFPTAAEGQEWGFDRLPVPVFEIVPPSHWTQGAPGRITLRAPECRDLSLEDARRRIVDVAVQEWAFFGFPVLDRDRDRWLLPPGAAVAPGRPAFEPTPRGWPPPLNAEEAARLAPTIAGYWAATAQGSAIVSHQNQIWNGSGDVAERWRSPWSAAFISWVMCEGGLGERDRFRGAVAHHVYIDQAIRARDGNEPRAAYEAFEIGAEPVAPGDLICNAGRPQYRSLAERRRQLGVGARTHCDVVVLVDEGEGRILAIGGNVLRSVALKVLPASVNGAGILEPASGAGRPLFAHLKYRSEPLEPDALFRSPTVRAFSCLGEGLQPVRGAYVAAELGLASRSGERC